MTLTETEAARSPRLDRVLNLIERIGNKLPDPFILFGLLFLLVAVVSTAISFVTIGRAQVTDTPSRTSAAARRRTAGVT